MNISYDHTYLLLLWVWICLIVVIIFWYIFALMLDLLYVIGLILWKTLILLFFLFFKNFFHFWINKYILKYLLEIKPSVETFIFKLKVIVIIFCGNLYLRSFWFLYSNWFNIIGANYNFIWRNYFVRTSLLINRFILWKVRGIICIGALRWSPCICGWLSAFFLLVKAIYFHLFKGIEQLLFNNFESSYYIIRFLIVYDLVSFLWVESNIFIPLISYLNLNSYWIFIVARLLFQKT